MSWAGMPKSAARWTILLGDLEADVRILGDAGVVVGDGDDGDVVLLDQRQDEVEALLLAGDGVDQRAAVGGLEAGLERARDAESMLKRKVDKALDELDHLPHQRRLGLVRVGVGVVDDAGVDIEHGGAAGDLLQRVVLDGGEVAGLELGGELLAAGGVDALADHAEGLVEADEDGPGAGCDDGAGHATRVRSWSRRAQSAGSVKSAMVSCAPACEELVGGEAGGHAEDVGAGAAGGAEAGAAVLEGERARRRGAEGGHGGAVGGGVGLRRARIRRR